VDNLVNVVGGNARLGFASCDIENLACQSADLAHTLLLLLCENLDPVPSNEDLIRHQHPVCHLAHEVSTNLLALGDTV
jgi:hypothetical protein